MWTRFLVVVGLGATAVFVSGPAAVSADRGGQNAGRAEQHRPSCHRELERPHPPQSRRKRPGPCGSSGGQALGDFNGDGVADLAVGVPGEDLGTIDGAGAVSVIYGSATGLTATGNQLWTQDSPDVLNSAEAGDQFGAALAAGDFNGDGFSDLAVGVPGEDLAIEGAGTVADVGAVNVLFGSALGLTASGNQFLLQGAGGILGSPAAGDRFGVALVWADFGNGPQADLAVGARGEDVGAAVGAGAVHVLYGSTEGITATGNQVFHQDTPGVEEVAETADFFGEALTAADFDGNGFADLAAGSFAEDIGTAVGAGAVNVLYAESTGLSAAGDQLFHQNTLGVPDSAESGDQFGQAVTAGDFNGDRHGDLAAGSPGESTGSASGAGAVTVLYGRGGIPGGLSSLGTLFIQGAGGLLDQAESSDFFGEALAAGDFDGDGREDLAAAAAAEDVETTFDAGAVSVVYGATEGLTAAGNQFWHQGNSNIAAVEAADRFGSALTAWNFGKSAPTDLAVGAPLEDVGALQDAGAVGVLYGSPDVHFSAGGLVASGSQIWHQDSAGILDGAEPFDNFGDALY
jgi:disulfide bond formation protein DsbB